MRAINKTKEVVSGKKHLKLEGPGREIDGSEFQGGLCRDVNAKKEEAVVLGFVGSVMVIGNGMKKERVMERGMVMYSERENRSKVWTM